MPVCLRHRSPQSIVVILIWPFWCSRSQILFYLFGFPIVPDEGYSRNVSCALIRYLSFSLADCQHILRQTSRFLKMSTYRLPYTSTQQLQVGDQITKTPSICINQSLVCMSTAVHSTFTCKSPWLNCDNYHFILLRERKIENKRCCVYSFLYNGSFITIFIFILIYQ